MKKIFQSMNLNYITGFCLLFCLTISCESFIDVGPPKTQTVRSSAFSDDLTATASVRGIYHEMINSGFASGQFSSVSVINGTSSDELKSFYPNLDEFYNNAISPANGLVNSSLWSSAYKNIYYSNTVLEGLSTSTSVTSSVKSQLTGEAKFIRAFSHFYLINLFGDVPIILSTDYKVNAICVRNPIQNVYEQIIRDLTEAQAVLAADYQFSGGERVRANAWAASALLARVYLYTGDWANAEKYSTSVINNTSLYKLTSDLNNTFLKNSTESILQLMPIVPSQNTYEGQVYIPASSTSLPTFVALSDKIVNSFESTDKRKVTWVGNQTVSGNAIYYPFKYKISKTGLPLTEYSMVLRLAEQYLIRAEARAKQNKLTESIADIDIIRLRAGLSSVQNIIPSVSMDNVLLAIEQERKVELFSEWGHRWFDLKRWGRADQVLAPIKSGWSSNDKLFPIPQLEISNNPNLNPQNPGY